MDFYLLFELKANLKIIKRKMDLHLIISLLLLNLNIGSNILIFLRVKYSIPLQAY